MKMQQVNYNIHNFNKDFNTSCRALTILVASFHPISLFNSIFFCKNHLLLMSFQIIQHFYHRNVQRIFSIDFSYHLLIIFGKEKKLIFLLTLILLLYKNLKHSRIHFYNPS